MAGARSPGSLGRALLLVALGGGAPVALAATPGAGEAPVGDADVAVEGDAGYRTVDLDLVSEPMLRNAGLAVAGAEGASRGLALAAKPLLSGTLARRDGFGVGARAAWTLWIDLPLTSLAHTLNHEYGHVARLPGNVTQYHVHLDVSAPIPTFSGSMTASAARPPTAAESMAQQSGGWEADRLALRRTREVIYTGERMHYLDALSYSLSKLGTMAYLLDGTRESRLDPRTEEDWHSDPLLYARWWSEIEEGPAYSRPAFRERARRLRRGAYWNLADYTFLATTFGWLKGHVVDGLPSLPSPWLRLGPVRVAPSASFTLTPIGPERAVLTGLRIGRVSGDVHVRWTDPVLGRRLIGGGGVLRVGRPGALLQSITVDAWRNPSATLGCRLEASGGWQRSPYSRIGLRWSLGAKSRGYLTGFSDSARLYAGLGLRAAF